MLEIHDSLPSTNERVLNLNASDPRDGLAVCLANHQSAGKGRGGKRWHSPPGAGLLLSVGRGFNRPPDSSLALALGVATAEALEEFVSGPVELKWPNDLIARAGKLGGILVESSAQGGTETRVVAGLGVNIRVSDEQRELVSQDGGLAPTGLSELEQRKAPDRNALAAAMIAVIAGVLERHPEEGFARWEDGWRRRDWLAGRNVTALCGNEAHVGEAAGVDASGALLLKAPDGERRIPSAEIQL